MMQSLIVKKPNLKFLEKTYNFNENSISATGKVDFGSSTTISEDSWIVYCQPTGKIYPVASYEEVKYINGVSFCITNGADINVDILGMGFSVGFSSVESKYSIIGITEEQTSYLIINGSKAKITNGNFSVEDSVVLPYSDTAEYFSRRLFLCSGNKIKVTDIVTVNELKKGIKIKGEITIPEIEGKIIKAICLKNNLVILLENAVYSITSGYDVEDLKIKKIGETKYEYNDNSAVKIGDEIYFCGAKNVYRITENRIESIEIPTRFSEVKKNARCGAFNRYYVMPLGIDGEKGLLYDTENKVFLSSDIPGVLSDGGHNALSNKGQEYEFVEKSSKTVRQENGSLYKDYLGTFKKKYLQEISASCIGNAKLRIISDNGESVLELKEGITGERIGIPAYFFEMQIEDQTPDFKLENLTIKYRVFE